MVYVNPLCTSNDGFINYCLNNIYFGNKLCCYAYHKSYIEQRFLKLIDNATLFQNSTVMKYKPNALIKNAYEVRKTYLRVLKWNLLQYRTET